MFYIKIPKHSLRQSYRCWSGLLVLALVLFSTLELAAQARKSTQGEPGIAFNPPAPDASYVVDSTTHMETDLASELEIDEKEDTIQLTGWAGNTLFKEVQNPALNADQQHYFDALLEKMIGGGYRFVHVNAKALAEGQTGLSLNVPQTESITLQQQEFYKKRDGRLYWRGTSPKHHGVAKFILNKNLVTGSIRIHDNYNRLYPLTGGLHLLIPEEDIFHHDCGMTNADNPNSSSPQEMQDLDVAKGAENTKASECRVRLLVAYTNGVDNASADISSVIDMDVDDFNDANQNSNVDFEVELARSVEVFYSESGSSQNDPLGNGWQTPTDLVRFWDNNDGNMDEVHGLRDLYDADLCLLYTTNLDGWGGFAMDYQTSAANSFCASVWTQGGATFAHEYGHLIGLYHDDYVSSSGGYARGYVWIGSGPNFRTIMAYSNECSDNNTTCPRILNWSNPDVDFGGNATGTSSTNDCARRLRERDDIVAGFQFTVTNKSVFQNDYITAREYGEIYGANTINTSGNTVRYYNGSSGEYRASQRITLQPGFRAYSGSRFRAHLESSCTPLNINGEEDALAGRSDEEEVLAATPYVKASPNPFSESTLVEFQLLENGPVTVEVFDLSSRLVKSLMNTEELDTGVYQVELEGADLQAGYYLCRVSSDAGVEVLKLAKISK